MPIWKEEIVDWPTPAVLSGTVTAVMAVLTTYIAARSSKK
jgi:hypothetical protein